MFEIIFVIAIIGYTVQTILFLIGVRKKFTQLSWNELPTASIIVAARNEEENILRCLESLHNLEYPEGKLEIILVDDRSTDRTSEIIDTYIADKPRFKKIISQKTVGSLKGKSNAIANAHEIATGDVILTTDADCAVPPTWARTIASYYTKDVATVNGFTYQQNSNWFEGMQNLDFIYLLTVGSGTINLNMPISCIGNNMSYTRRAYREVGGYESLPFSVTEDSQLLLAIAKLKKYKLLFPLDKQALVVSKVCPDFLSLYRQKKRWVVGGLGVPAYAFSVLINGWFTMACIVLAPFFFSPVAGWLIFLKILLDYLTLRLITADLKITEGLKHFISFEIYYMIYVLALPLVLLLDRKVIWKDRTLS
ncbi:MAG: glycosyltransferase [Ignavibacteria bacterium]|nr:glycosyltransferase [Ignavibacteria bacterium]